MRAFVELTAGERKMMQTLTEEEREAVIEQMLSKVREELEWIVVVDRARLAAAKAPALVARADASLPVRVPVAERTSPGRFRWPTHRRGA